jgi:transcriptional regulator with XRE-family HTH domain
MAWVFDKRSVLGYHRVMNTKSLRTQSLKKGRDKLRLSQSTLRLGQNKTQQQVADLAGLSVYFVQGLELGKYKTISVRSAVKLAKALEVDLMEFINYFNL